MVHLVIQPLHNEARIHGVPWLPGWRTGSTNALPAPPSPCSRLEIELEPKVQTPPISESRILLFQRERQGCFHLCPAAVSVSHSDISGGSHTTQRMKSELPSTGRGNLYVWLQTFLPALSVSSLHCHPYVIVKSDPFLHQQTPFAFLTTCLCKSHFLNLERPALPSPYQSIKILHERPRKMSCPHYKTFLFPRTESNFLLLFFFLFYSTWTWGYIIVFLKSLSLQDCELIARGHSYLIHLSPPWCLIWNLEYLRDTGNA